MSSSVDLYSYTNSEEIIRKINEHDIPDLLKLLSEAQCSIPPPAPNYYNRNNDYKNSSLNQQVEKLQRNLNSIQDGFNKLKKFEHDVSNPIKAVQQRVDEIVGEVRDAPERSLQDDLVQTNLRKLNQIVTKLKIQVLSAFKPSCATSDVHQFTRSNPLMTRSESNANNLLDGLRNLHMNEQFRCSSAVEDIEETYESLDDISKRCLLCFAAFPENEVVKKTLLIYWWIGGDLVIPKGKKTVEDVAEDVFKELTVKGFIEPVNKKRRLAVQSANSFKMCPFIRSAVILLAQKAGFFYFNSEGTPNANFLSSLVKSERASYPKRAINARSLDPEKIQTFFNVSEPYLAFELEWLSKMKNVNVLYLGRWLSSAKHHIEVVDTEFLKVLKYLKELKFLSLQGISRMTDLPNSICKLTNLRILDLRACHSLEVLPNGIGSLKNLTYLDMSECYLLGQMPKGLALLFELQVLKGFVVGHPKSRSKCTLHDLVKLNKLWKLSITTGWEAFPTKKELTDLRQFKALRKLTIAWSLPAKSDNSAKQETAAVKLTDPAATNPDNRGDKRKQDTDAIDPETAATAKPHSFGTLKRTFTFKQVKEPVPAALPMALEKLVLQCFPQMKPPSWLMPDNLKKLKKLYIRGGKLHDLGHVQEAKEMWAVEVLRLKFLCELKMGWRELQMLFPKLSYLEKVKCPKLILFPCDESGVWLKHKNGTKAVSRT